jgi:hypothetical protein
MQLLGQSVLSHCDALNMHAKMFYTALLLLPSLAQAQVIFWASEPVMPDET